MCEALNFLNVVGYVGYGLLTFAAGGAAGWLYCQLKKAKLLSHLALNQSC